MNKIRDSLIAFPDVCCVISVTERRKEGLRSVKAFSSSNSLALADNGKPGGTDYPVFIGEHPLMRKLHVLVERVASTDATVLITGESGTGKELVARAIHGLSPHAAHPFVPVNCAAIPGELLESELFGHVRGAFTGAVSSRPGMFKLANGGTILLDEVGEIPLSLQAKLLRVLQNGEVRPVGTDQPLGVNVRIIASTNKDLEAEVGKGRFREDLFYRLQVVPIHLPPLRARRSDIPLLVHHFLEKNNRRYGASVQLTTEAMIYLWEYDWPGNVRQLENLMQQMVILSPNSHIGLEDLPDSIRSFISEKKIPQPTLGPDGLNLQQAVEEVERRLIDEALRLSDGNRTMASRMLGLKRTTLVAKLRQKNGGANLKPSAVGAISQVEREPADASFLAEQSILNARKEKGVLK